MFVEQILFYLAITTGYGWYLYRRGMYHGARTMGQVMIDARVVKSKEALKQIVQTHFEKQRSLGNK